MFLLDTNVISELRKVGDGRADPNVVSWVSQTDSTDCYLSAITIMEIELSVLLRKRSDQAQGALLEKWMTQYVLPEFADRILPVDTDVALRCAALHIPNPRPTHDALIAATGLVHGMTVVTRNVADFTPAGVPVVNPWER